MARYFLGSRIIYVLYSSSKVMTAQIAHAASRRSLNSMAVVIDEL